MNRNQNDVLFKDMKDIEGRSIQWDKLRSQTILVTGANGMLASYIVKFLMHLNETRNSNIQVIALVRNQEKAKKRFHHFLSSEFFTLLVQDVCEPIKITREVDYVVHAAGNASPKFILSDPVEIIRANTMGTWNVLELARKKKVKNLIYLSTREVYGRMPENVTVILESEYGALNCKELRSCYPESKRISETMLESYHYMYGVPYTTVRIAHSYGPGMEIVDDGRIMSDLISDVVNHRDIILKSDGSAERAFCYLTDAVAGIFTVLLHGKIGEAYNLANEKESVKIKDLAEKLMMLAPKKDSKVVFQIPKEQSAGYSKMGRVKLNTEKLKALGWTCQVELVDGLNRTVASFLSS